MANIVFQGPAALTLDSKGRIAVPARHRELLKEMGVDQLTITRHPEGPLIIFPRPTWEDFRTRLSALPMDAPFSDFAKAFVREAKTLQSGLPDSLKNFSF